MEKGRKTGDSDGATSRRSERRAKAWMLQPLKDADEDVNHLVCTTGGDDKILALVLSSSCDEDRAANAVGVVLTMAFGRFEREKGGNGPWVECWDQR